MSVDFDSTPTVLLASYAAMEQNTLVIQAVDIDNDRWTGRLHVGAITGGAKVWWASSLMNLVDGGRTYPLRSEYDPAADEWFCRVGNYGIHSRDIEWTEGWDD